MKKLIVVVLASLLLNCAAARKVTHEESIIDYDRTLQKSQQAIFNAAAEHFALAFNDVQEVVQHSNTETGKIIGKGIVNIDMGFMAVYGVKFTFIFTARANGYHLRCQDYSVPATIERPLQMGELPKLKQSLNAFEAALYDYVK